MTETCQRCGMRKATAAELLERVEKAETDLAETRAQLARLREAVAEPERRHFGDGKWHHTCLVCGAQWMGGSVGSTHPPSKTCALSTSGPTLAEIRRSAQVQVLRDAVDTACDAVLAAVPCCNGTAAVHAVRRSLEKRADDLEAGR